MGMFTAPDGDGLGAMRIIRLIAKAATGTSVEPEANLRILPRLAIRVRAATRSRTYLFTFVLEERR
jgi:hypothetical protein